MRGGEKNVKDERITGAVFKPLEPKIPPHRELQEVLRSRLDTRHPPYHDHLSDGLCNDARYVDDHCDRGIQNGS